MLQVVNIHFCEALGTDFKESDLANFSFVFVTLKFKMAAKIAATIEM